MADSQRLRVLLVTRNLPPLVGGMERLNWHAAEELAREATVKVIGPRGAAARAPSGVSVEEVALNPLRSFLLGVFAKAWRTARRWRPHVIFAGSGLTALPVWFAARVSGARAVAYVHGLDLTTPHPVYRWFWLPALRHFDRVICNSRATRALAEEAGIAAERIGIVHPGVTVPQKAVDAGSVARFRRQQDVEGCALLLSVGRLNARKGLKAFVRDVLPRIVELRQDAVLMIVGGAANDALNARSQSEQDILAAAQQVGMHHHVRFTGLLPEDELELAYAAADVHVFPIQRIPNDPEGFGMVAVEAAAHGLPSVAYAVGGVTDAIRPHVSGLLVMPGRTEDFATAVLRMLEDGKSMRAACEAFAREFDWTLFGMRLREQLALPSGADPEQRRP